MWHRYAKKPLITSSEFTCASTCLCYKVAWGSPDSGPEVRGPKFGARSSGPDSCGIGMPKKTFDYIIIVHVHVLLRAFATKLPGGTLFGPEVRGPKFGARSSGPEVRGPTLVAQVCQKTFDYIIRIHIHVLLRTCLCYKVAWGHPVRGPKFGARLLWHRYGIRTRWIETHVCPLLLLWDEARNPII